MSNHSTINPPNVDSSTNAGTGTTTTARDFILSPMLQRHATPETMYPEMNPPLPSRVPCCYLVYLQIDCFWYFFFFFSFLSHLFLSSTTLSLATHSRFEKRLTSLYIGIAITPRCQGLSVSLALLVHRSTFALHCLAHPLIHSIYRYTCCLKTVYIYIYIYKLSSDQVEVVK